MVATSASELSGPQAGGLPALSLRLTSEYGIDEDDLNAPIKRSPRSL